MAYYKKDQLSIKTRKLFADYLADLILIADSIQSFRIALAQTQFFNGIELFRCLDKDEKGYLTPQDFAPLVSDQTKKVFHYAFSWFDVSKVGEITRAQFLQFLFPQTNQQLRNIVSERMLQQCTPEQRKITLPIQQDLLRELILQIMRKQTRLIPLRRNLMDQHDYTLKAAMNCLDVEGRGWITTADIYKFLGNFDIDVEQNKVCGMLGVFDNDLNGKISINELQWLIQGLEKNSSSYRKIVRQSDKKARNKIKNQRCSCYKQKGPRTSEKPKVTIFEQQSKTRTTKKITKNDKEYSDRKQKKNKQKKSLKRDILNEFSERISETKQKKKQKKQLGADPKFQYLELKSAVLALQKQTQDIDEDLRRIQHQMGIRTQVEFEQEIQNARIKRKLKKQQQQMIRIRMQELEMLQLEKQKQALRRIKEEEARRLMEEQNRRILELEKVRALERENEYFRQVEQRRLREAERESLRLRELEEARLRQAENRRIVELEQNRLSLRKMAQIKLAEQDNRRRTVEMEQQRLQFLKRKKQLQLENLLSKKKLEQEMFDRQIRAGGLEKNIKLVKSELDWNSQAKLRLLHEEEVRQRMAQQSVAEKENQYFWRYNNYCQNLANIADPLGIKEHLAQTDKYLLKSKEIRDELKRDRAYSATKFSNLRVSNKRKLKLETQNDQIEKTPEQRRDVIETINKRTQQTKLAWSEN